ncbi:MAG: hypothetical protein Q7S28_00285 [bacterium]|nr:hypothetical protein [bacterium]
MASRNEGLAVKELKDGWEAVYMGLTNGPNQQDLTLCLQRIVDTVIFVTEDILRFTSNGKQVDANCFEMRVTSLRAMLYSSPSASAFFNVEKGKKVVTWEVNGEASNGDFKCWFSADYSIQARGSKYGCGVIRFSPVDPAKNSIADHYLQFQPHVTGRG